MFFSFVVLPYILGNDFFFVRVPYRSPRSRHQTCFPCSLVSHGSSFIYSITLVMTKPKLSFILRAIFISNFSLSINKILGKVSFICKIFVNVRNQLSLSLLFPVFKIAFVNNFILVLSINSISIDFVIFPLPFINIPIIKNGYSLAIFCLILVKLSLINQCVVWLIFFLLILNILFKNQSIKVCILAITFRIHYSCRFKQDTIVFLCIALEIRRWKILALQLKLLADQRVLIHEAYFLMSQITVNLGLLTQLTTQLFKRP